MKKEIRICPEALDDMLRWARSHYPREACGIWWMNKNKTFFWKKTRNIKAGMFGFEMGGNWEKVWNEAKDHDIKGFFHSHCSAPALPSITDQALLSQWHCFHLILSLRRWDKPRLAGWRLAQGEIRRIRIAMPPDNKIKAEEEINPWT